MFSSHWLDVRGASAFIIISSPSVLPVFHHQPGFVVIVQCEREQ
jgi:hypothetical protein